MRKHKTPINQRRIYKLRTVDENLQPVIRILKPGEDGISEDLIHSMHALDDSSYYYNARATDPYYSLRPEDKHALGEKKKRWSAAYIQDFKKQYGYEPHPRDVTAALDEAFPHNKVVSLEEEWEHCDGNDHTYLELLAEKESEDARLERLHELIRTMPEDWQYVYKHVMIGKRKYADVAAELDTSEDKINYAVRRIKMILHQDKILSSFY